MNDLRAEVALLRDTVHQGLTEKLKTIADSEAEVQSELREAQLRDEQQHSEVQALSESLRRVVHEVQKDV